MPFKNVVVVAKFQKDHTHQITRNNVLKVLESLSLKYKVVNRNRLNKKIKADLVVSIGGDGTALAVSHFLDRVPLLAVNSSPKISTGFFCLANSKTFSRHLKNIVTGKRKYREIPRMEVRINGKRLPYLALNEILFASRLQGDTARYYVRAGSSEEFQKSSGVWVATGAGSTAAIYSAGGKKASPFSKGIQYLVREPFRYSKTRYRLLRGFLNPGKKLTLISEMDQGMIFIDGAKLHYRVPQHAKITVQGAAKPLRIYL